MLTPRITYTISVPTTVIRPLSALSPSAAKEYLLRQGNDTAEIIDWKYFDPTPNRGGERGFACIQDDRITAFVGLIPFQASDDGINIETAWSCDWYRDLGLSGPVGILLLKHSLASYGRLYSLGGNENTRAILPRLSQTVVLDAAVEVHKPLRMGGAIRALGRAAHLSFTLRIPFGADIPLQRIGPLIPSSKARLSSLFPPSIEALLEASRGPEPHSCYNLAYITWQLRSCPLLISGVCTVPGDAPPRAAVFYWHSVDNKDFWRIAAVSEPHAREELDLALTRTIQHIHEQRGWMVSALVSRQENELLQLLRKMGFITNKRHRPLFIMDANSKAVPGELKKLSYLDTDYAYRFPIPVRPTKRPPS